MSVTLAMSFSEFVLLAVLLATVVRGAVGWLRDFLSGVQFCRQCLAKPPPNAVSLVASSVATSTTSASPAPVVDTDGTESVPQRRPRRDAQAVKFVFVPKTQLHFHISDTCRGLQFCDRTKLSKLVPCSHCAASLVAVQ